MSKINDIKYPSSARLFSFCKRVMDVKFDHARVIDQDVGQILGFDPADCSHWKKGRKHVKSVDSIRSIAEHLGIDERLVMDVVSGDLTDEEAFLEYQGLGQLDVNPLLPDSVRRDWQQKRGQYWSPELEAQLNSFFSINDVALNELIEGIHQKIQFQEAPLFLPEISRAYSSIVIKPKPRKLKDSESFELPEFNTGPDQRIEIQYVEGTESRPVVRFHIARAIAHYFVDPLVVSTQSAFAPHEQYMKAIYSNIFALRLLVPARLVRAEMAKVHLNRDIVAQLSEMFWVSRTLMNRRLKDILSGAEY